MRRLWLDEDGLEDGVGDEDDDIGARRLMGRSVGARV